MLVQAYVCTYYVENVYAISSYVRLIFYLLTNQLKHEPVFKLNMHINSQIIVDRMYIEVY